MMNILVRFGVINPKAKVKISIDKIKLYIKTHIRVVIFFLLGVCTFQHMLYNVKHDEN